MKTTIALAFAVLSLSACVTPQPILDIDPQVQRQALQELDTFNVSGGLSVWTNDTSLITRVRWKQRASDFDINISLPAGISSVRVLRNDGLASVRRGSRDPVIGRSAGILMQQALGLEVAVPLEQMSSWIKGIPGESAQSVEYDDDGLLRSMVYVDEQGTRWNAEVTRYTTHERAAVPSVISAVGGPYNVKLTLRNWGSLSAEEELGKVAVSGPSRGRLSVPGR